MRFRTQLVAALAVLAMTLGISASRAADEFSLDITLTGAITGGTFFDAPADGVDAYSTDLASVKVKSDLSEQAICFEPPVQDPFIHDQDLYDDYKDHFSGCYPANLLTLASGDGGVTNVPPGSTGDQSAVIYFYTDDGTQLELRWGYNMAAGYARQLIVENLAATCGGLECWSLTPDPDTEIDDQATLFVFKSKNPGRGRHAIASYSMPFELIAVRANPNLRPYSQGGKGGGKGNGRGGGGS
jgi:hypothetical protein